MGRGPIHDSTRRAGAVTLLVLLLLATALLPAPALAGTKYTTLTQFEGGLNSTAIYFGSCQSTSNSTKVKLPYDANVSAASLTVSSSTNATNSSNWISVDVGDDGSQEANFTLSAFGYAEVPLGGSGFNNYTGTMNQSSGNVSVPLLFTTCAPAGGWNLTFYNVSVSYFRVVASNTSSPTFSGPIANLSLKVNKTAPYAVYLPYYFADADNDTLNYTVVQTNASDPGWSNVTASFNGSYLGLNSTNNWTGNLTFRIDAADPANLTASSNNITLQVYLNRAPVFGNGNGTSTIANQTVTVNLSRTRYVYLRSYFSDPDFNDTVAFSVDKEAAADPGWANVTVDVSQGYFIFNSTNGWLGNLTFRVRDTDSAGAFAVSNVITVQVKPNEAPTFSSPIGDVTVDRNTVANLYNFSVSEPDDEPVTLVFLKSDPNATGWAYVNVSGYNGSSNITTGYLTISTSGNWSGTVSGYLRATDPGGLSTDSNAFNITVNGRPFLNGSIPDPSIVRGTTAWQLVNLTPYLPDPEGDPVTYYAYRVFSGNNSTTPIFVNVNGSFLDIGSTNPTWTGSDTFYVYACDGLGRCAWSNYFDVFVTLPVNRAPVFNGTVPDIWVVQGRINYSAVKLASFFSDPEGDTITLGFSKVDPNATGWLHTTVTWNGTAVDVRSTDVNWLGTVLIAFWARDTSNVNVFVWSNNVSIRVVERNLPPSFTGPIGDLLLAAGTSNTSALDADAYFSDPNGLALTYTIVNQSQSDGWNYTTAAMNGSLLEVAESDDAGWTGDVCFAIRATDVNGSTANSNDFCLRIDAPANAPPAPSQPMPVLRAPAGTTGLILIDLSQYFTDDRYVTALNYSIIEGSEPEWSTVNVTVEGSLLKVAFVAPTAPANLTFQIVVRDLRGASFVSAPIVLEIDSRPGNRPPQLAGPPSATLGLGALVEVQLQAYDEDGDALTWRVQASASGLSASVDAATQKLTLSGAALDERATFEVLVTVGDGWGGTASFALPVKVWSPAVVPDITLEAAANRTGALWVNGTVRLGVQPSASQPPAVQISLDGASPFFATLTGGSFAFQYPSAVAPGAHTVTVSVTDGYGRKANAVVSVTVPPPLPAIPRLLGILSNGAVPDTFEFNVSLTFVLDAASPMPDGVNVSWYLDGQPVGFGAILTGLQPVPGYHTLEARASNGFDERSVFVTFTVFAPPPKAISWAGPSLDTFWLAVAVLGGLAVFGAFAGGTEVGRYFVAWTLFGSVFARLKRESLLDHFVRGRIYQVISDEPGIHLAELRRRTNIGHGTAIHHLRVLEKGGYLRVLAEGTLTRFYPTDRPLEAEEYGLSDSDRAVLSVVAGSPGITPGELSSKLERSPSTVSRSIFRLQTLGYVTTEQIGRKVAVFPRPGTQRAELDTPDWARPNE